MDVANNARQLVETLQPEVLAASKESAKAIVQFSSTITTTISGAVTTGSLPDVDLQVGEIFHKTLAASQSLSGWFDNVAPIAADFVKGAFGVIEHVPLIGFAGRILGMMQQTVQGALVNKEECRKLIECVDSLRAPLAKYERLLTTDEERELIQVSLTCSPMRLG